MVTPYAVLKRFSRIRGQSIDNFLALDRRNDPFYAGSVSHLLQARWAKWVYQVAGSPVPVHVRRLHYLAASLPEIIRPDDLAYTNSPQDWDLMRHACKYARYLGLIPLEVFEDRRNVQPLIFSQAPAGKNTSADWWLKFLTSGLSERVAAALAAPHQPYYVEVWLEKSSVLDEVLPIAKEYMVNVVASLGEMSLTAVVKLVQRIVRSAKPVRLFYLSDFDPAGRTMPLSVARKLEFLLRRHRRSSPQVKLRQLMLTAEQCVRYGLPRIPIGRTNPRKARFEQCHGPGVTELDALAALHPGIIGGILSNVLACYCSRKLVQQVRSQAQELVNGVGQELRRRVSTWIPVLGSCGEIDLPGQAGPADSWLFDSARDYLSQLEVYHSYLNHESTPNRPDCDWPGPGKSPAGACEQLACA